MTETAENPQTFDFGADVSRLLDIVVHSLYSDREVFLRELIANAADATDRRRFAAQTDAALHSPAAPAIQLIVDSAAKTLTVRDAGIGMTQEEMRENLGTIARSGTGKILETLKAQGAGADVSLIGQFGVGFYSAFMVADRVRVVSRAAGSERAWAWESDGKGTFTLSPATKDAIGTDVVVHLKKDAEEFLSQDRLRFAVQRSSDHLPLPIMFGAGENAERLNRGTALWQRPKSEITEDAAKEFYRHVAHAFDDPARMLHLKAEGALEYAALLFIPTQRPMDLFDPKRAHHVRLHVKRMFITEGAAGLIPPYLRFLRGVVDSEDLPLNVSRELLQQSPLLNKMRSGIVKKVLTDLAAWAESAPEDYARFWRTFGLIMKEGLYEDQDNHDALMALLRFRTTKTDGDALTTLKDYVARMPEGQKAIYTLTGTDEAALRASPQLEGFAARGIEVLLLTDPVDDFWLGRVPAFQDHPFRSITRADAELEHVAKTDAPSPDTHAAPTDMAALLAFLKETYGGAVKDVRTSQRLTSSAVCLVAEAGDLDFNLEKLLRQHGQLKEVLPRVLEINAAHPMIGRLNAALAGEDTAALHDAAWLLLDQARILEGEAPLDVAAFARRLADAVRRGLAG